MSEENLTTEKYQVILERLNALSGSKPKLDSHLGELTIHNKLPSTNAKVHCHYLKLDGNGGIKENALAEMLSNYAIDYAIPQEVRAKAIAHQAKTGSFSEISKLSRKARGLFKTLGESGEGGELLLYMLIETFLGYPQLLCKMSLKTNTQVHVHGIDGIHGFFDKDSKKLKLFWGESKLYKSVDDGIKDAVKGLADFLIDRQGSKARGRRDIELLRDGVDLTDEDLEAALCKYLDPDDDCSNSLEYCGICLVGFDVNAYPKKDGDKTAEDVIKALNESTQSWFDKLKTRITSEKISQFDLHIFCLPFKSVAAFRKSLIQELSRTL